ncbi:MAG TPA: diguanylate cyclase [Bryobacteraceae bacterium]|nr:diguanylate cyclase [Bryobacteraceae bacterium]
MTLRILLAVSVDEDIVFLEDVLTEVEGREYWSDWVHLETVHAASWEEAEAVLTHAGDRPPVDLLLLDLSLRVLDLSVPAARDPRRRDANRGANQDQMQMLGVEAFRRAQAAAPNVPVVLLVTSEEIAVAEHLLREGAQDFLIKSQVDCGPLAHAIRNAIERHRYLQSARAAAMTDSLTGLLNRSAFLALAERDRKLAAALDRRILLAVTGPESAALDSIHKQQDRDLTLVEAAERLRELVGPLDLLARIGERGFALAVFETEDRSLEEAWTRLHGAAASLRLNLGAAVFRPDSPVPLEELLEQAQRELAPVAVAARR